MQPPVIEVIQYSVLQSKINHLSALQSELSYTYISDIKSATSSSFHCCTT